VVELVVLHQVAMELVVEVVLEDIENLKALSHLIQQVL
jgi:hypothetical protein